jgi:hypothetical protein
MALYVCDGLKQKDESTATARNTWTAVRWRVARQQLCHNGVTGVSVWRVPSPSGRELAALAVH